MCGCPVYIRDAGLWDAGRVGLPQWDPRSCLEIYLGHSPVHAGNIARVLNPKPGSVLPQFHVVFGDNVSTVPSLHTVKLPDNWKRVKNSREKSAEGFYDVTKT